LEEAPVIEMRVLILQADEKFEEVPTKITQETDLVLQSFGEDSDRFSVKKNRFGDKGIINITFED
jgi:hypothetical protein